MAPSDACNYSYRYRGEMVHPSFTAKPKLSFSLMLFLLTLASARLDYQHEDPTDSLDFTCESLKFMNESASKRNLKVVMRSLVDNVNKTGFYTSSHGDNGDAMYGIAQCRGDLNASTCRACVSNVLHPEISEICDPLNTVRIHMSGCFVKYNTSNFYSELNSSDGASYKPEMDIQMCDGKNVTAETWSLGWNTAGFLKTIVDQAASSKVGYSTGTNNDGLYSLAQCWRNLNMNHCTKCLNSAYTRLGNCPSDTHSAYALYDNCILRYDGYKFYGDGTPLLSRQPSTGPPSRPINEGKTRPHLPSKLGLTIGGVVSVVVLVGLVLIWKRKIINPLHLGSNKPANEHSTAITKSKLNYKFQTLQIATKKFNPANKIGQGGFGAVYKGVLPNGREIAVKRLFANREQSVKEFCNEVNLISRVQHKNLLNLFGFSVDGPDKFLVYEYLPNKSLDHFLYNENMGKLLDWQRRFDIILGVAGGLAYLHQESDIRIIHRDIKASNILLDQHFKPKIADFGLVRHFGEDQTHLSTTIVGTRGYMAPEYLVHGQLTE